MEAKTNIAELLKDCPKGMELDCTMYDNVTFERFDVEQNRCYFKAGPADTFWTTCYGKINGSPFGKCVIFPKGETTWEGFVPPREFKDGDVVATTKGLWIGITAGGEKGKFIPTYCVIQYDGKFEAYLNRKESWVFNRLATEEEKEKLFQSIKDNGYKWNPETKTLEKLVVKPKFKVGGKVRHKNNHNVVFTFSSIEEDSYVCGGKMVFCFNDQDEYELAQNKFDINTLKPLDKVLVRDNNEQFWTCDWFSFHDTKQVYPFACVGHYVSQCIPYEGNQHLLGTSNDCDEYFKNW